MPSRVRELTDADFAEAVRTGVVLVNFHGTYCPPCALLEPAVRAVAARYAGRALVARVNVDDNFEAAADNAVEDIPTIIFFRNGEERKRLFGNQTEETLCAELDRLLA